MADGTGTNGVKAWGRWHPNGMGYAGSPEFEYLLHVARDPQVLYIPNVHIIRCRKVIYAVVATYDDGWKLHRHEREFKRTEEAEAKAWCEVIARML